MAALSFEDQSAKVNGELRKTAQNVTFISAQGGSVHVYEHAGVLVAVHTDSKQVIWRHDKYRRYMDIDPIGNDRILFVAGERVNGSTFQRIAVLMNWRTGEVHKKFKVPRDTHDIDYLGGDRFAIADKKNHRISIYNSSNNSTAWEFDYRKHYSKSAGGGPGDWTHLNDVDSINNGSAFLASPRNFDRVMSINRSTKEVEWTLGEEDNYNIMRAQHNPVLLSKNPLTVLVADSENQRIVEYQRKNGEWKRVWGYRGDLHWPRDADRLPNGNTLITDTLNDRVVEVTPDREIVWEFHVERSTYDVERLQHGDEPAGPTMASQSHRFEGVLPTKNSAQSLVVSEFDEAYRKTFQIATWVLPGWVTLSEFIYLLSALGLAVGWVSVEAISATPLERVEARLPRLGLLKQIRQLLGGAVIVAGLVLIALVPASGGQTGLYLGLGLLAVTAGTAIVLRDQTFQNKAHHRLSIAVVFGLTVAGTILAIALVALSVLRHSSPVLYTGLALLLALSNTWLWSSYN
ncbi:hypothetical protein DMJ13_17880 [halophilic archaeon]|nr:hypothetical protein DMJ13_17880 [halophilic archaeon]